MTVFTIVELDGEPGHPVERSIDTGWGFPYAALGIGTRHNAGHGPTRYKGVDLIVVERVGLSETWKKERGILAAGANIAELGDHVGRTGPVAQRVDQ